MLTRRFPLSAVLTLREQREAAEERVLTGIGTQMNEIRATIRRLQGELVNINAGRSKEIHTTRSAAEHQASQARWTMLREAVADLQRQLQTLEMKRLEQQRIYLGARREREMIADLRDRHQASCNDRERVSEEKFVADLFTARRVRKP